MKLSTIRNAFFFAIFFGIIGIIAALLIPSDPDAAIVLARDTLEESLRASTIDSNLLSNLPAQELVVLQTILNYYSEAFPGIQFDVAKALELFPNESLTLFQIFHREPVVIEALYRYGSDVIRLLWDSWTGDRLTHKADEYFQEAAGIVSDFISAAKESFQKAQSASSPQSSSDGSLDVEEKDIPDSAQIYPQDPTNSQSDSSPALRDSPSSQNLHMPPISAEEIEMRRRVITRAQKIVIHGHEYLMRFHVDEKGHVTQLALATGLSVAGTFFTANLQRLELKYRQGAIGELTSEDWVGVGLEALMLGGTASKVLFRSGRAAYAARGGTAVAEGAGKGAQLTFLSRTWTTAKYASAVGVGSAYVIAITHPAAFNAALESIAKTLGWNPELFRLAVYGLGVGVPVFLIYTFFRPVFFLVLWIFRLLGFGFSFLGNLLVRQSPLSSPSIHSSIRSSRPSAASPSDSSSLFTPHSTSPRSSRFQ